MNIVATATEFLRDFGIKQHPKAASSARSMKRIAQWVKTYTDIRPQVIAEIGANYGQDAEGLRHYFRLAPQDVWVFEAHPDIFAELKRTYSFHAFNVAVFNREADMTFHVVDIGTTKNSGISSLYRHKYSPEQMKAVTVRSVRMDAFMKEHELGEIDILKLDVEGCNYEVLEGFGKRLGNVKVLHVEAEHESVWAGQKLYGDIERILRANRFELALFERHFSQSDSLWVQRKYFKRDYEN